MASIDRPFCRCCRRPSDSALAALEPSNSSWKVWTVIENVVNALAAGTPSLRERYLQRISAVRTPEARQLEERVRRLVELDRSQQSAA